MKALHRFSYNYIRLYLFYIPILLEKRNLTSDTRLASDLSHKLNSEMSKLLKNRHMSVMTTYRCRFLTLGLLGNERLHFRARLEFYNHHHLLLLKLLERQIRFEQFHFSILEGKNQNICQYFSL